jgi:non-canonical purine NTP pyrophosphatase (RdgB/HAM1 family)
MRKDPLVFITSNRNKLKQVQTHLQYPIEHIDLNLTEIQSLDPLEIATYKAKEAYNHVKKPVLIEDTSLIFNALGKLPGPFIKWFYDEIGLEGMCRMLDNYKDRSALAWIIFAYYDGIELHIFDAKQQGMITEHPQGENGFGWNPIFMPHGQIKTYAEMTEEEKRETSLRKKALIKLDQYLIDNGQ